MAETNCEALTKKESSSNTENNVFTWGILLLALGAIFFLMADTLTQRYEEAAAEYRDVLSDLSYNIRSNDYNGYLDYKQSDEYAELQREASGLKLKRDFHKACAFLGEKGCYVLMIVGAVQILYARKSDSAPSEENKGDNNGTEQ